MGGVEGMSLTIFLFIKWLIVWITPKEASLIDWGVLELLVTLRVLAKEM
jgi:hypothetical protein